VVASLPSSYRLGWARFYQCTGQLARIWPARDRARASRGTWASCAVSRSPAPAALTAGPGRPGAAGHRARSCIWGGRIRGVDDYLLIKLASSGVLRAHEPLVEASIKMAGTRAGLAVRSRRRRAAVRYRVTRIGSPPSGLPYLRLGGGGTASLRCPVGSGAVGE
jgi:hypothetical protein